MRFLFPPEVLLALSPPFPLPCKKKLYCILFVEIAKVGVGDREGDTVTVNIFEAKVVLVEVFFIESLIFVDPVFIPSTVRNDSGHGRTISSDRQTLSG